MSLDAVLLRQIYPACPPVYLRPELYNQESEESLLDQFFVAILTSWTEWNKGVATPLHLLAEGFRRASKLQSSLSQSKEAQQNYLSDFQETLMRYATIALEQPEAFGERAIPMTQQILDVAKADPPAGFFSALFNHMSQTSAANLTALVYSLADEFMTRAAAIHDYGAIAIALGPLHILCAELSTCEILLDAMVFLPPVEQARLFESQCLLGGVMSAAIFSDGRFLANSKCFSDAKSLQPTPAEDSEMAVLRRNASLIQARLRDIFRAFLRVKHKRDRVLDFFATSLRINAKRTQTHGIQIHNSTDGFMLNMTGVLLQLSLPFANVAKPQFDKIDESYLLRPNCRIDIRDESRIADPPTESIECEDQSASFTTECFFLTLHCIHVGLMPIITKYQQLLSPHGRLMQIMRYFQHMQRTMPGAAPPPQISTLLQQLKALQTHVLDPELLQQLLQFMAYVCSWVCHLIGLEKHSLPLPVEVPPVFALLPEYIFEDIAEFLLLLSGSNWQLLDQTIYAQVFVQFMVTVIGQPNYVKNPYLRSKFVEALARYTPQLGPPNSRLLTQFFQEDIAVRHMTPFLMRFSVDIEETDVYSLHFKRYCVAVILQNLWQSPTHRESLVQESKTGKEFVRFAMLMINDATHLMDEARDHLDQIYEFQEQRNNPGFSQRPRQEQQEVLGNLQQFEHRSKQTNRFAKQAMTMFVFLTADIREPFLRSELVTRLAYMLNYNIVTLVDSEGIKLSMADCHKFGFEPDLFLKSICKIYLQVAGLSHSNDSCQTNFVEAIARDGRSYKPELFRIAVTILRQHKSVSEDELQLFETLLEKCAAVAQRDQEDEEDLGDIPDEFLDPIMATLMTDPVMLPTSKQVVDRATIASHLLSDPTDPFNRNPLQLEDVVPDDELKAKIEAWVAERRRG
eukprot:m.149553 g.149553  ORF g.149553 m.149553 type:complete len:911 (-) comp24434_c0_seq2:31-2763(-)